MCRYYVVISDALIALGCIFLVARCDIMGTSWKTKKKLQKKVHRRICVRDITAYPPSYIIFPSLFLLSPTLSSTPILRRKIFLLLQKLVGRKGTGVLLQAVYAPWNYINIKTTHPFLLLLFLQISFFWFLRVHFLLLFRLKNWIMYHVVFMSVFRTRCWELLCKTAVWQDITKIFNFFYKIFQYSLLNKKVYKFIKNKILDRCFSRAMVKRSI